MLGDEERDLLVDLHAGGGGLGKQDRHAHLELGRFERHRKAPAETRNQPLLDAGDFLGVGVAGDHHLLVRLDERVEQIEELFLGSALAAEELDVVDEQQIERAVVTLEVVEGLVLIGPHHVGDVGLGVDVADLRLGAGVEDVIADGLDQVRLAKTDAAVDEQRVVGSRMLGYLHPGGARQLIGLAGDEGGEGKPRIQARLFAAPAALHRRRRAPPPPQRAPADPAPPRRRAPSVADGQARRWRALRCDRQSAP